MSNTIATETIDVGIDLGTTNSAIAVLDGMQCRVLRGDDGFEYTPSAVWIDSRQRLRVGRRAREAVGRDPVNVFREFKASMGTDAEYVARGDRRMRPEDLSAEVLKALKAVYAKRMGGDDLEAAVITVPADFKDAQSAATRRAAELAGFALSPLVLEPTAAGLAYGFDRQDARVNWLVYDFGGGTFDAAIIRVHDGMIEVVGHGGDDKLGGKLIDWAIVESVLAPAVAEEYGLSDFRRGNPRWAEQIAKLKYLAEEAKIQLSQDEEADVVVQHLIPGEERELVLELTRSDLERIAEPLIARSINICREVMREARLGPANLEKVILVGGPTLTPCFRERLADSNEGLGVPLQFSVDPLTVVAQGAAIFAGSQRITGAGIGGGVAVSPATPGQYVVDLEYEPAGPDTEPPVGGRVRGPAGSDLTGFTIEFVNPNTRPEWRSGRVPLSANGAFLATLWAEKGVQNTFRVELFDETGTACSISPDRFAYRQMIAPAAVPLIHSVGVEMANNEVDIAFEKGAGLPTDRWRSIHVTVRDVRKSGDEDALRIPLVEGEWMRRANRNRRIGWLEIKSSELTRDLPAGSEVEITLQIDESRKLLASGFIPSLDLEIDSILNLGAEAPDPEELRRTFEQERQRLEKARDQAQQTKEAEALQRLQRIDDEQTVADVETTLAAAAGDRDAADTCQQRLQDLMVAIDAVEDALQWPTEVAAAEAEISDCHEAVAKSNSESDRQALASLEGETRQVMEGRERDAGLLQRKISELLALEIRILQGLDEYWIAHFLYLEERKATMRDQAAAEELLDRGRKAMIADDITTLRATVNQLRALLPEDEEEAVDSMRPGTILARAR